MTAISEERLAIDGGAKAHEGRWPTWPIWDETEEKALLEALHSGNWWDPGGVRQTRFEEAFAHYQDARFGVCVTNGTAALEICLRALSIGPGDEVIVPPYTFVATASSVLSVCATPVFVDIEPHSLNIDATLIERAITPRTKAIIAVHIAGCPADLDAVMAVARKHNLYVIEDAAQAHGAEWKGRKVGAIGHLGTFSFQGSKNLNAGEGGIIVSDDEELAERCWSVMNVGRVRSGRRYEHHVVGGNFRITVWQTAILMAQFSRLPEQTARRNRNGAYLTSALGEIPGILALPLDNRVTVSAYHLYPFRYNPAGFGDRSLGEFLNALNAEGIPCSSGYGPLYKERAFNSKMAGTDGLTLDYSDVHCPVCEQISQDTVWLPQTILLAEKRDMEDIATAIRKIHSAWGSKI